MLNKILEHLDFLIQQDTQNPPRQISKNDALFKQLESHFSHFEFDVEITDLNDGHVIFYAVKGNPTLLFNVHLDTVPVTKSTLDEWTCDPFKLTIKNDKAYGRGSCDIKGAAACLMTLAENIENLAVVFTTDEEGASGCCVQHFIDNNDLSHYKQIIVAEPTNSKAVVSHRGYLSCQTKFFGKNGHSSMAIALKENAIHKANKWLAKALDFSEQEVTKSNPAGVCFNVGVMNGGEKNNMIAETVQLNFSARVPAGSNSSDIYEKLKALDSNSDTYWHAGMMAPALPSTQNGNLSSIQFCEQNNITVAEPVDFWTEAALFSQAGSPALVLGPGDIKQAHTIDEWVYLSQLQQSFDLYLEVSKHGN